MQTKILAEQMSATTACYYRNSPIVESLNSGYVRLVIIPAKLESIIQALNRTGRFQAYALSFFFSSGSYDRVMNLLYNLYYYAKLGNYSLLINKLGPLIDNIRQATHELEQYLVEYRAKDNSADPAEQQRLLAELQQKIWQSDKQIVQSFSAVLKFLRDMFSSWLLY
jgi:hypothetical protein